MARRLLASVIVLMALVTLAGCAVAPEQLFEYVATVELGEQELPVDAVSDESDGAESDGANQDEEASPLLSILVDRLNVRGGPGLDFPVVGKLFVGDLVEPVAASDDGEWLQVAVADLEEPAWIAAAFAQGVDPGADKTDAVVDEDTETTTAETEDPDGQGTESEDTESEDSASENSGDVELILTPTSVAPTPAPDEAETAEAGSPDTESEDTESENGGDAELILAPTPAPEPEPEPSVPTAYTQPDRMNIRSGPGTQYPVVGTANKGTTYEIQALSPDGAWYQVAVEGAEDPAWIFANLAETAGPLDGLARLSEEELPELPKTAVAAAAPAAVPVQAAAVNAPPPSGGGFFGYGVQAHMLGGGIGEAIGSTSGMGFNWIKQQVEWHRFEGSQGAVDFSELRRITDAAGANGISVLFSVVNAPEWAREAGFDSSVGGPPADPQTYAAFVGRLAGELCGTSLKAIEVWNEQNLHYEWGNKPLNPADYMNLLRPAYASIKAACPSMLVISGAPTPAGDAGPFARDDFAYLEGMYQNGLARYSDGIGAHPSGYNVPPSVGWESACAVIQGTGNFFNGPCDTPHHSWSFRSTMEGYRNIMVVYGDANKRVWPTEFGWAVGPAVNNSYAYANDNDYGEQAAWTAEAYTMMRNWGWVGPAFLWNLNFRVVADGTEKAQWGIVRNDYSPLPVYEALRALPK